MRPRLTRIACLAALVAALARNATAQPATPHIGYVYPAGGRQGARIEITVGGQFLDNATNVFMTGRGVTAAVVQVEKPLTPMQATNLRDQMRELQQKRTNADRGGKAGTSGGSSSAFTEADLRRLQEIRRKLAAFVRRPASAAIAEKVTLQVTLADDAETGIHELRLGTPQGLSNPLGFRVGFLPEVREPVPSLDQPPARRGATGPRDGSEPRGTPPTDITITLPVVINGQILPGEEDRYRFQARKGQQLLFSVQARDLIPYLADAVPGWFQATLALYDSQGKEVAYNDDYRFRPDPVLLVTVPRDGEYSLVIRDAIYRGREDFVYRITAGELPFITSIFPLGGPVGARTVVEVRGWNLATNQLVVEPGEPGQLFLSLTNHGQPSNLVPFIAGQMPEFVEREPNDSATSAQAITLPAIVNGRIDRSGDVDVFRFDGHAGDKVVAEVCARRLDSPLDSVLRLTDSAGKELAYNDDFEDKGSGLNTHHADSYLSLTLPADGAYFLELRDAQRAGGPEYTYRLRVSAPQPDFALRVAPSTLTFRAGGTVPISVYALRRDGFKDPIRLALVGAPPGFTLSGAVVPAGEDQVRVTLSAPGNPRDEPFPLALSGHATISGHVVTRKAVPADDLMQAFAYHHLVPAQELAVSMTGRFRPRAGFAKILEETPIKIPSGGTAHVLVNVPPNTFFGKVELELSDPPPGLAMERATLVGGTNELLLACDAKTKPGLRGNLIVTAYVENTGAKAAKQKTANRRRVAAGTLPAIPFEITSP